MFKSWRTMIQQFIQKQDVLSAKYGFWPCYVPLTQDPGFQHNRCDDTMKLNSISKFGLSGMPWRKRRVVLWLVWALLLIISLLLLLVQQLLTRAQYETVSMYDTFTHQVSVDSMLLAFVSNVKFIDGRIVLPRIPASLDEVVEQRELLPRKLREIKAIKYMFLLSPTQRHKEYTDILTKYSNQDKEILLSTVDYSNVDMAINFYLTSLRPHDIDNVIYISPFQSLCNEFRIRHQITCFPYIADDNSLEETSEYTNKYSQDKSKYRTKFILEGLENGFSILHIEFDVTFFTNPFSFIPCGVNCDLLGLEDRKKTMNRALLYLKSTNATISAYKELLYKLGNDSNISEQSAFNKIIKKQLKGHIQFDYFKKAHFLTGIEYFEEGQRYFAGNAAPCPGCIAVYNNWIVSKQAKVYRLKEMHMWRYDEPDQYYTHPHRKYLSYQEYFRVYTNAEDAFFTIEKKALRNAMALGQILDRTVILPKFHGNKSMLPLNNFVSIKYFDEVFGNNYRESTFLTHPDVPEHVKKSAQSNIYHIISANNQKYPFTEETKMFYPKDKVRGASEREIRYWFGSISDPVLKFHSLYNSFSGFEKTSDTDKLDRMIEIALQKAGYRQY